MTAVKCHGCGGTLQNADADAPFYTPKPPAEDVLCQRCYRMRHYGEILPARVDARAYADMLKEARIEHALVVNVVDLFDLEGSILPNINALTNQSDVLVALNKRDVLPRSVNDGKLRHRALPMLKRRGLQAKDAVVVSAEKKIGIDRLIDRIAHMAHGRDIYVVGATNVGKSSLINAMLSAAAERKLNPITVSKARGTTQGLIAIPFEDSTLFDTPGLFNPHHASALLDDAAMKQIQPTKEIKPRVYQLSPPQTLFLAALARFDIEATSPVSAIVYAADAVNVHRRKTEGADAFFTTHGGERLTPFVGDLDAKTSFSFRQGKHDIVIPGLAFVSLSGPVRVTVHTPKGLNPYKRGALI